jgi:hypothetical protein
LKSQKRQIIKSLHDEIGHRGTKIALQRITRRYQWKGMYADVEDWVKSFEICQKRARNRLEEPLHPTWSTAIWEKVGADVVYMPPVNVFGLLFLRGI